MAKKSSGNQPKGFIKKKAGPQLGFRTTDNFKSKIFGGSKPPQAKFNPAQFKTQHKG